MCVYVLACATPPQLYLARRFSLEFPLRELEAGSVQGVVVSLLDRCADVTDVPVVIRHDITEFCGRHNVVVDDVLVGVIGELVDGLTCLPPPENAVFAASPYTK